MSLAIRAEGLGVLTGTVVGALTAVRVRGLIGSTAGTRRSARTCPAPRTWFAGRSARTRTGRHAGELLAQFELSDAGCDLAASMVGRPALRYLDGPTSSPTASR